MEHASRPTRREGGKVAYQSFWQLCCDPRRHRTQESCLFGDVDKTFKPDLAFEGVWIFEARVEPKKQGIQT
jgi:hypothetical protein